MSGTRLLTYEAQLNDASREAPNLLALAGGAAIVTLPNSPKKATLFNPDTGQALANPVSLTRGRLRFATQDNVPVVDIYGFGPDGGFFIRRGLRAGAEPQITYAFDQMEHLAVVPMAIQDFVANTEGNTGLQFALGSLLLPTPAFRVTTQEASRTVSVGLLSTESGGNATGLLAALSLAALGTIGPAVSGTPTLGALLVQNFATSPAVNVPHARAIAPATARTISVTFSASTAAAQGYFVQPYLKPAS
jgi:hypothetical protein